MSKRLFDVFFAAAGLILLAPLFALVSVWIKLDSPGPVMFRQIRVGRHGKTFRIHKFRTMVDNPAAGRESGITVGADPRITRSGRFLRKHKLDELAQLIDVLLGDMSLVGPRPEIPRFVEHYPEDVRRTVLSVRPGITDLASITFKDEAEILSRSSEPERTYVEEILPIKLGYCVRYAREHSLAGDVRIILSTLGAIIPFPHRSR